MTHRTNQQKVNAHAGPQVRVNDRGPGLTGVNGHGPASTNQGGVPEQQGRDASGDGSGAIVVRDTSSSAAPRAVRPAHAKAAQLRANGHRHETAADKPHSKSKTETIPGGEFPLPVDPGEFVEEIHRRVDLFRVWQSLLNNSKDPKIQQRAVEKLTEMRYKGVAALADEPQQIVIDIDSAAARRAAEGARK
jgi:hypothetical protein